jgi:hypothetical protein
MPRFAFTWGMWATQDAKSRPWTKKTASVARTAPVCGVRQAGVSEDVTAAVSPALSGDSDVQANAAELLEKVGIGSNVGDENVDVL